METADECHHSCSNTRHRIGDCLFRSTEPVTTPRYYYPAIVFVFDIPRSDPSNRRQQLLPGVSQPAIIQAF